MIDTKKIREDFPILDQKVYGKQLVYLDNAATTQKPRQVIDSIVEYYRDINSNIHRGVHYLSQEATVAFEEARKTCQNLINAEKHYEIIFTRGTTESINLVANTFGKKYLGAEDEVLITTLEHHSNIVPWQMICEENGSKLKVIPINEKGEADIESYKKLLSERTRIVAIAHVSNALGTILPIKEMIEIAHKQGIAVLIDGAQSIPHIKVDVRELDCDFYCFSGHKMYGPMGIGVMYGKEKWLEDLPPYMGGGEMIKDVTFERIIYNELPFKFEAGTPNVGDGIGLERAIEYMLGIGYDKIEKHEHELVKYATEKLLKIDGLKIYGTSEKKSGVVSFNVDRIHPYDLGTLLDKQGIAVRTGNHCAQPVMDFLKIPGTVRASFAIYNTNEEIDILAEAVKKSVEMLR